MNTKVKQRTGFKNVKGIWQEHDRTDERTDRRTIAQFQIEHRDQQYNAKVFRPQNHLSGHAQTFPPGYRSIKEKSFRLQGAQSSKRATLKKEHA